MKVVHGLGQSCACGFRFSVLGFYFQRVFYNCCSLIDDQELNHCPDQQPNLVIV
jgi:hypothetical protein